MKKQIIKLMNSVDRPGIKALVSYLKKSDYFTAPASTRYHGCYKGGLAKHSMNVYNLFKEKNEKFDLKLEEETIIICALLHDLCKVHVYTPKILKSGNLSHIPYSFSDNLPLGHSSKSLYIINRFISLQEEEALIIRWHMSWSDYEFKKHIDKAKEIVPAIMAFITSDIEASTYLEGKK